MDPRIVFLASGATALLVGGGFVGSLVFLSDDDSLGWGNQDLPAASDVMAQGLPVATQAQSEQRMGIEMQILDDSSGASIGTMDVRFDPATENAYVHFALDLDALGEDLNASDGMDELAQQTAQLFSDLVVAHKDGITVLKLGGDSYAFRDMVPDEESEDDFPFMPFSDPQADAAAENPFSPQALFAQLEEFQDDAGLTIEAGEWQGERAYIVKGTFTDSSGTGEGTFYFRASDNAPLHFEVKATEEVVPIRLLMDFTYGSAVTIPDVDADTRWPVTANLIPTIQPDRIEATVPATHTQEVPRGDIEIHVAASQPSEDLFGAPQIVQVYARFNAADASGSADGFTFEYTDANQDGYLSAGDTIVVTSDGNITFGTEGNTTTGILLFDTWADAYEGQIPDLGLMGLLAGLGAAFVAWRRR